MAAPIAEQLHEDTERERSHQSTLNDIRPVGAFIIHSGSLIEIPLFFVPGEISDSYQPAWNDQVIPGRSEPIRSYSHGGPRKVSYNLILMAQGGTKEFPTNAKSEVYDKATQIRSALYPRYGAGIDTPPLVSLLIGRFIQIKGILSQAEIRWMAPWDVVGGMFPMRAEIAITIEQVNKRALDHSDILNGRGHV